MAEAAAGEMGEAFDDVDRLSAHVDDLTSPGAARSPRTCARSTCSTCATTTSGRAERPAGGSARRRARAGPLLGLGADPLGQEGLGDPGAAVVAADELVALQRLQRLLRRGGARQAVPAPVVLRQRVAGLAGERLQHDLLRAGARSQSRLKCVCSERRTLRRGRRRGAPRSPPAGRRLLPEEVAELLGRVGVAARDVEDCGRRPRGRSGGRWRRSAAR